MQIHLDPSGGVPIYLQIVNQIRFLVSAGRLKPGEEVPPIRALAQRLVINPNTVARAYRELEEAGVLTKRSTTGTFVSQNGDGRADDRLAPLLERADALLADAAARGISLEEIQELIRQRHRAAQSGAKP